MEQTFHGNFFENHTFYICYICLVCLDLGHCIYRYFLVFLTLVILKPRVQELQKRDIEATKSKID